MAPGPAPPSEWELTPDEIKLIQKRVQLRSTTKAEFLKRYRNPFYQSVPGHFVSKFHLQFFNSLFPSLGRSTKCSSVCLSTEQLSLFIHIPKNSSCSRSFSSRWRIITIFHPEKSRKFKHENLSFELICISQIKYNNDCNAGKVPYANRPDFKAFF